jgi:hypothetical protein
VSVRERAAAACFIPEPFTLATFTRTLMRLVACDQVLCDCDCAVILKSGPTVTCKEGRFMAYCSKAYIHTQTHTCVKERERERARVRENNILLLYSSKTYDFKMFLCNTYIYIYAHTNTGPREPDARVHRPHAPPRVQQLGVYALFQGRGGPRLDSRS